MQSERGIVKARRGHRACPEGMLPEAEQRRGAMAARGTAQPTACAARGATSVGSHSPLVVARCSTGSLRADKAQREGGSITQDGPAHELRDPASPHLRSPRVGSRLVSDACSLLTTALKKPLASGRAGSPTSVARPHGRAANLGLMAPCHSHGVLGPTIRRPKQRSHPLQQPSNSVIRRVPPERLDERLVSKRTLGLRRRRSHPLPS